jgi:hypothetical protein
MRIRGRCLDRRCDYTGEPKNVSGIERLWFRTRCSHRRSIDGATSTIRGSNRRGATSGSRFYLKHCRHGASKTPRRQLSPPWNRKGEWLKGSCRRVGYPTVEERRPLRRQRARLTLGAGSNSWLFPAGSLDCHKSAFCLPLRSPSLKASWQKAGPSFQDRGGSNKRRRHRS